MKILNLTGHSKIDEAIEMFMHDAPLIIEKIAKHPGKSFTYTDKDNHDVAMGLKAGLLDRRDIEVKIYYPKWRWSAAIGYTAGTNEIFINGYKIDSFAAKDYAGNIAHEWVHIVGYSHGDNYIDEVKKKSVPYSVGYLISGESNYPFNEEAPKEEPYDFRRVRICTRPWRYLKLKLVCRDARIVDGEIIYEE